MDKCFSLLLFTLKLSMGDVNVSYVIRNYENPKNYNGQLAKCEKLSFIGDYCDPIFYFSAVTSSELEHKPNVLREDIGPFMNMKSIKNVMQTYRIQEAFPDTINMELDIRDSDLDEDEKIALFRKELRPKTVGTFEIKLGTVIKVEINVTLECTPNYFGSRCEFYCIPYHNLWSCDPETGIRVCAKPCLNGQCVLTNTSAFCLCAAQWLGDLCETPVAVVQQTTIAKLSQQILSENDDTMLPIKLNFLSTNHISEYLSTSTPLIVSRFPTTTIQPVDNQTVSSVNTNETKLMNTTLNNVNNATENYASPVNVTVMAISGHLESKALVENGYSNRIHTTDISENVSLASVLNHSIIDGSGEINKSKNESTSYTMDAISARSSALLLLLEVIRTHYFKWFVITALSLFGLGSLTVSCLIYKLQCQAKSETKRYYCGKPNSKQLKDTYPMTDKLNDYAYDDHDHELDNDPLFSPHYPNMDELLESGNYSSYPQSADEVPKYSTGINYFQCQTITSGWRKQAMGTNYAHSMISDKQYVSLPRKESCAISDTYVKHSSRDRRSNLSSFQ